MTESILDIAVIGAGGAGTMAYLRGVLNGNTAALFTGDADSKRKGRATWVMDVDNIPGLHDLNRPITKTSTTTRQAGPNSPQARSRTLLPHLGFLVSSSKASASKATSRSTASPCTAPTWM